MKQRVFKVGDRVRNTFTRGDGSTHSEIGTVTRIWGKVPYAATVNEDNGGAIRACLSEIKLVKKA